MVSDLRGKDSVGQHDEWLRSNWNSVVAKNDVIYVLGDVALNHNVAIDWMKSVRGHKYLIAGNHDACHPLHSDWAAKTRRYLEVFKGVTTMASQKINGEPVMLSHFPYEVDHVPAARFMEWRLRDEGRYLLHGHTHTTKRIAGERQIHVGVDAWHGFPVGRDHVSYLMHTGDPRA